MTCILWSNTLIVRSAEPVQNHVLLGSTATDLTHPKWPLMTYNKLIKVQITQLKLYQKYYNLKGLGKLHRSELIRTKDYKNQDNSIEINYFRYYVSLNGQDSKLKFAKLNRTTKSWEIAFLLENLLS